MTQAPAKSPLLYFVVLLLVNTMWAFQFSGAKIATAHLGPITVTFLPMALSTLFFAPFVVFRRRSPAPDATPASRREIVLGFLAAGTLGIVASQLGLTWGVLHSLASNASVITLTIPVLTAALAAALLGEKMTGLRWVAFLLAIAGVLLVSDTNWNQVEVFRGRYLFGNLLILVSCFGSAFYNTYSKKLLQTFNPIEVMVYSYLVTDTVLLALMVLFEPTQWRLLLSLDAGVWLSLATIAVFSLSTSTILFFWVIERIDVTQASLSIYLLPVLGVAISAVTLHERVTSRLLAGGGLVLLGTFLVTTYEERRKAAAARS